MAKKCIGKFLAFATLAGAVAAGVSYFLKYKSFNKELDEDFHDFEGDNDEEEFDGSLPHEAETMERTYVTLNDKKNEAKEAVKEAAQKTEDMAKAAVDAAKDTAEDLAEKTKETAETAAETAKEATEAAKEAVKELKENSETTTIEDDSSAVQE